MLQAVAECHDLHNGETASSGRRPRSSDCPAFIPVILTRLVKHNLDIVIDLEQ